MSGSDLTKQTSLTTFSKGQKWSFGMGSFAQWFINSAFNLWVFTFYFSAVKLNIKWIMIAYVFWTLWNAVNDPLIGYLSDRSHSRFGRRKLFIMIGTIPILILEIIIWIPPTNTETAKFIYLLIMLFCYDTFYSMVSLPFDALFPELYTTVEDRAEVNSIKQILSVIGLILAALIPGIFIVDVEQQFGYLLNGIVTTIIVAISLFIAIKWGAVEREEFSLDYQKQFSLFKSLKYTLKNKGFVLYTIMFFLYEYILLLLATIVPLFGKHVIHTTSTFETTVIMGILYIVGILSVVIWRKIDLKVGSKTGYTISMFAYFLATIPFLFVSGENAYLYSIITVIFMGFGFGGMLYYIYLLIADVIDEDELKTGIRREGAFFGITNFFMRLSMIISILSVGLVFSQTGWEEYAANPGVNVIIGLRVLFVIFPGIALGISGLCLIYYPFTKSRVSEIKTKLLELHKEKKEKVRSI
ncbi:MAG: MFS transporter [Candidatus Thorarchaeota archaeon]